MKTELYIENNLVELDESVTFAITKEFNNLSNPTTIINDWTKEVNIPFTNSNHKLFGHLYNPNKEIYNTTQPLVGRNFNPNLKFNFKLLHNGTIIMTGYMKMNSITQSNGYGSYNVTLNGSLGDVFQKMKNIGFDENSIYKIDAKKYVDTPITKDLVYDTFVNTPESTTLTEDAILSGEEKEGYYIAYKDGVFKELRSLNMSYIKIQLLPDTYYYIDDIKSSPNIPPSFYGMILYKGNNPVKALFLTGADDTLKDMDFYNTRLYSYDYMVINYYRYAERPVIIRKNNAGNIIGFTFTNSGYYPNFDSKSFNRLSIFGSSKGNVTIQELLEESPSFTETKYTAESAIGDGLLPRQIGEFRSYYQQPYIYFNKLFQIFTAKAKEVTGYEFDLDADWFNEDNPYWSKLCMLLKNLHSDLNTTYSNKYYLIDYSEDTALNLWDSNYTEVKTYEVIAKESEEQIPLYKDKRFYLSKDYSIRITSKDLPTKIRTQKTYSSLQLADLAFFKLNIHFKDNKGNSISTYKYAITSDAYTDFTGEMSAQTIYKKGIWDELTRQGYTILTVNRFGVEKNDDLTWTINLPINKFFNYQQYGSYITISADASWHNNQPLQYPGSGAIEFEYPAQPIYWNVGYSYLNIELDKSKRSYSYFDLSDLWDAEYNLFNEIINYTKMMGLIWEVDSINRKIKVTRRVNFFKDYTIEDWSNKVDYSQDFTITPLIIEDKHLLFNYEDIDSNISTRYKEDYGANYGELIVDTGYSFNNNTKELFENPKKTSIVSSDSLMDYIQMLNGTLLIQANSEIYPDLNKDNEKVDGFGSYFFRNENQPISSNIIIPTITDDTEFMQNTNNYNYILNESALPVLYPDSLPYLSIKNTTFEGFRNNNLCLFNKPSAAYSSEDYTESKSIYYNFWENYIRERYSNKTKKITCWINLTPMDYYNFKFNKFITIENQLYFVNKIYDYDVERQISTKVDLLTVNDIRNFYSDNYNDLILLLSEDSILAANLQEYYFDITVNRDFSSENITSPIPYSLKLIERYTDKDVYRFSFFKPEIPDTYTVKVTVEGVNKECIITVPVSDTPYFELSSNSVEWEADGEIHTTTFTINTNQIFSTYVPSTNLSLTNNDGTYTLRGSSNIATEYTIVFKTKNGDTYTYTVTFTEGDTKITPTEIRILKGLEQTTTFRIETNGDWTIEGELPSTITLSAYNGTGDRTIQVTSNCEENIIVPLKLVKYNGAEFDFSINIYSDTYLYYTPNEFYFTADGNINDGVISIDTNIEYTVTGDLMEDETNINLMLIDNGILITASSNEVITKYLTINSELGNNVITINFI